MNRVVYERTERDVRQRIRTFVAQSKYDRGISTIAKAASDIKQITFPSSIKETRVRTFEKNEQLSSVILDEGLERLEGPGDDDDQHGSVFGGTNIKSIKLPSTLKTLGNNIFQGCKMLRHAIFRNESKLKEIGSGCFINSGIEEIIIPNSVTTIYD